MVNEVSDNVWDREVADQLKSVFFDRSFAENIANCFKLELHYFCCIEEGNVLFAAIIYSSGKSVITPLSFTYYPIFFNDTLTHSKYISLGKEFLELLKSRWNKIQLRLPPDISDLRPFIWTGFKVDLRYTYIKTTNAPFDANINKNLTKSKVKDLTFRVEQADNVSITANLSESLKYGVPNKQLTYYFEFFKSLPSKNFKVCKVYERDTLITSELILIDELKSIVYALLILPSKQPLSHRFMHQQVITWCKNNDLNYYDFCGANDEGIAQFKSYFNVNLKTYHLVFYSKRTHWVEKKKYRLIEIAKAILEGLKWKK